MKKSDLFLALTLAFVISFSFLSIKTSTNKAFGQTGSSSGQASSSSSSSGSTSSSSGQASSSSSSSGSTSSSSGEASSSSSSSGSTSSSSGEASSSSSSGSANTSCIPQFTNCSCMTICARQGIVIGACDNPSCTDMLDLSVTCGETSGECVITSSGTSTSSSSSSGTSAELNSNFTGVWKAELPKPQKPSSSSSGNLEAQVSSSSGTPNEPNNKEPRGSRIITFKLCIKDGELEGTVQQGGVLNMGVIISQTVISPDEVSINVEGEKGAKATINLKLTGEREFIGAFADGRTFKARKLNPFKSCLAPGVGPSTEGGSMSGHGSGSGMSGSGPEGMGDPGMGTPPPGSSSGSPDGMGNSGMGDPGMGTPPPGSSGGSPDGMSNPGMGTPPPGSSSGSPDGMSGMSDNGMSGMSDRPDDDNT